MTAALTMGQWVAMAIKRYAQLFCNARRGASGASEASGADAAR